MCLCWRHNASSKEGRTTCFAWLRTYYSDHQAYKKEDTKFLPVDITRLIAVLATWKSAVDNGMSYKKKDFEEAVAQLNKTQTEGGPIMQNQVDHSA